VQGPAASPAGPFIAAAIVIKLLTIGTVLRVPFVEVDIKNK
jgi:hypothetical protein